MRIGSMVDDEIDNDAQAALLTAMSKLNEVAQRAVSGIDSIIIGDVVTIVPAGRRLKRHQPDRGDAEPLQIIQPAQQPFEVTDAVAVGVHVSRDREAVKDAVFVPEVVDHAEAALFGPPRCRSIVREIGSRFCKNIMHKQRGKITIRSTFLDQGLYGSCTKP